MSVTFGNSEHSVLSSGNAEIAIRIVHANSIIAAGAAQAEILSLHNWDNGMEEFQMILKSYCQANSLLLIFSNLRPISQEQWAHQEHQGTKKFPNSRYEMRFFISHK